jgi:hypothetical protein
MRLTYFLPTALALAGCAAAQIETPGLGWIFDSSAGAIRPLTGIAGAAVVGDVLELPSMQRAVIASRQGFALAVMADDARIRLVRLQGGSAAVEEIPGLLSSPDRILLSPGGVAAVVYQRSLGRLQLITGLPDQPQIIETSSPAAPVAVSDDGSAALEDEFPAPVTAAAFRPNGRDVAAISGSGEVFLRRDGETRQIASLDAAAAWFSSDGSRVYLAGKDGKFLIIEPATGASRALVCGCAATSLDPLNRDGLFRITDGSPPPVFVFDAAASEARFWFIPLNVLQQRGRAE